MAKYNTQDVIKAKDLRDAVNYAVTQQLPDEQSEKRIKRTAKQTVTVADVIAIVGQLTGQYGQVIMQLQDRTQIQEFVLLELGATEETFEKAKEKYTAALEKHREEILAAQKQLAEEKESK
ncbi:hypothetical protein CPT_Moonbeam102 [Bacillus phage Moonbeam]|uniref:Uncharacterized protein n=1 Tax=Bacillus phage Moonbeam TaxID=1540091 RepID=A0A0A0RN61_9CAUD|nr:hypothetical protein CPT_Moonbeam102 [Bacillus phage Moonbeam]AIW03500.1 hypothetical protein CPT_Moonbeam102 [Bacillus phage Moonbeam]